MDNVEAQIKNACWHADESDFETIVSCKWGCTTLRPQQAVEMSA